MFRKQLGVAFGMAIAMALTVALFLYDPAWNLPDGIDGSPQGRLALTALAWLGPLWALIVAIGVIANRRFFSPADIDGAGLSTESPALRVPRAILANTHEQATLAALLYAGLAFTLPPERLALPLLLSAAFVVGRIAFGRGYARGAGARAFGFGLTFYPTVGGAVVLVLRALDHWRD